MSLKRSQLTSNLLVLWECWVLPCYMVIFWQIIVCHRYPILSNNWSDSRFHLRVFKDFYLRSCEEKVAAQKQMVWRKKLGFHLMPSITYGWLSIPGITQADLCACDGYLVHTAGEIKLLSSSNLAIWAERRDSAGLMERFDKSIGSAHAPVYKEGKHFAENDIRKMKQKEMKTESGRFTLLEDHRSRDAWTSPSISSHPLKQCMFLSDNFRPTLCVGVNALKTSKASLVHVAPLDRWGFLGTSSCNPRQRQVEKCLETPAPHMSPLIWVVCSSLAKPQLKTWWAAES